MARPDLPGHGASGTGVGSLTRDRVLDWLDALIEHAGPDRSVLVGHALGGAVAARYAVGRSDRLRRLILVDTFGLVPLQPAPDFAQALDDFLADPSDSTHDRLGVLRRRFGASGSGCGSLGAFRTSTSPGRTYAQRPPSA